MNGDGILIDKLRESRNMTEAEKFELLKMEYISKAEAHLKIVENLSYEKLEMIGNKGILANSRLQSTTSYSQLLASITGIKTKMP